MCLSLFSLTSDDFPNKKVQRFMSWYFTNANELKDSKSDEHFNYRLKYLPNQLLLAKKFKDVEKIDKKDLKREISLAKGIMRFSLKVYVNENVDLLKAVSENIQDYNSRIIYLSYQMQKDIRFYNGSDTLTPIECSFERTYGIGSECRFSLSFKIDQLKNNVYIEYDDVVFSGKTHLFEINKDIINNAPDI